MRRGVCKIATEVMNGIPDSGTVVRSSSIFTLQKTPFPAVAGATSSYRGTISYSTYDHNMRSSQYRRLSWATVLLAALMVVYSQLPMAAEEHSIQQSFTHEASMPSISLYPGELPGYTGWARPDATLAGRFRLVGPVSSVSFVGQEWTVHAECLTGCPPHDSWFYVRAYGPAILAGKVTRLRAHRYQIQLQPLDPGVYTVEVVMTFSQVPPIESFPLGEAAVPFYEGYLLADFPYMITVRGSSISSISTSYCNSQQLQNPEKARWKVVDSARERPLQDTSQISLQGYQRDTQSLGVQLDYQHADCRLITKWKQCGRDKLHIVLIGDSVMRLQKDWLEQWAADAVQVSFYGLYGGTLRCERLSGPKVSEIGSQINPSAENTVVVFNTGLHDIHRLCGSEWENDRSQYLSAVELKQSCIDNYRTALQTLLEAVEKIPAATRIFQTTTVAWPKYGNCGINWNPTMGQGLPLDFGFIDHFNDIAVQQLSSSVSVVVGYWVMLARPDHREVDADTSIGKKLSHPGQRYQIKPA